jgi:hypothetical protein
MAEENYRPNGWLGIQLGKAVWVPCWNVDLADQSLPMFLQRAKTAASAAASSSTPLVVPPSSPPASGALSTGASSPSEVVALLKVMQAQLDTMQSQLARIEAKIAKMNG